MSTSIYRKKLFWEEVAMGCLKGESEAKKKAAKFACEKCGAAVKKKGSVCKPVKLEGANKAEEKSKKSKKSKK